MKDIVTVRFPCSTSPDGGFCLSASRKDLIETNEYFQSMLSPEHGFAEATQCEITVGIDLTGLDLLEGDAWPNISGYLLGKVAIATMPPSQIYYLHKIVHLMQAIDQVIVATHVEELVHTRGYEAGDSPREVAFLFMLAKALDMNFGDYFSRHEAQHVPEYVALKEQVCELLEVEDTVDFLRAWVEGIVEPQTVPEHACVDLLGQRGFAYRPPSEPDIFVPCGLKVGEPALCPSGHFSARLREFMPSLDDLDFPWYSNDKSSGVALCGSAIVDLLCEIYRPKDEWSFYVWGRSESGRQEAFYACLLHLQKAVGRCYYVQEGDAVLFLPVGQEKVIRLMLTRHLSPLDVVRKFPVDWNRCYYLDGKVRATTSCAIALRSRCVERPSKDLSLYDAYETLQGGFSFLETPEMVSRAVPAGWTDGVSLRRHLSKTKVVLDKAQRYYYPTEDDDRDRDLFFISLVYRSLRCATDDVVGFVARLDPKILKSALGAPVFEPISMVGRGLFPRTRYDIRGGHPQSKPPVFVLKRVTILKSMAYDTSQGRYCMSVTFAESPHTEFLREVDEFAARLREYLRVESFPFPILEKIFTPVKDPRDEIPRYEMELALRKYVSVYDRHGSDIVKLPDQNSAKSGIARIMADRLVKSHVVTIQFSIENGTVRDGLFVVGKKVTEIFFHTETDYFWSEKK